MKEEKQEEETKSKPLHGRKQLVPTTECPRPPIPVPRVLVHYIPCVVVSKHTRPPHPSSGLMLLFILHLQ